MSNHDSGAGLAVILATAADSQKSKKPTPAPESSKGAIITCAAVFAVAGLSAVALANAEHIHAKVDQVQMFLGLK
jgi:hypothetical protein